MCLRLKRFAVLYSSRYTWLGSRLPTYHVIICCATGSTFPTPLLPSISHDNNNNNNVYGLHRIFNLFKSMISVRTSHYYYYYYYVFATVLSINAVFEHFGHQYNNVVTFADAEKRPRTRRTFIMTFIKGRQTRSGFPHPQTWYKKDNKCCVRLQCFVLLLV